MKTVQFVGAGTLVSGNNASPLTPGAPSWVPGDLVLILAANRTVAGTSVSQPLGWKQLYQSGRISLIGRIMGSGAEGASDAMPALVFSGGAAGNDTIACAYALRFTAPSIDLVVASSTPIQTNAAAANIATPALTTTEDGCCVLSCGVKVDDFTAASKAGNTSLISAASTAGNDIGIAMTGRWYASPGTEAAGTIAVTGGAAAASMSFLVALRGYSTTYGVPVPSDTPCSFTERLATAAGQACVAVTSLLGAVNLVYNRQVVRVSSTPNTATTGQSIQWSSIDIDPAGCAVVSGDRLDVLTPSDGLWVSGASVQTQFTGTAGNSVRTSTTYNSMQVPDLSAAGYPPSGGSAMSVPAIDTAFANYPNRVDVSAGGTWSGGPLTVTKSSMFIVRMSDRT